MEAMEAVMRDGRTRDDRKQEDRGAKRKKYVVCMYVCTSIPISIGTAAGRKTSSDTRTVVSVANCTYKIENLLNMRWY